MAVYLGFADNDLFKAIQYIALMSIVLDAVRHDKLLGGVMAGLGVSVSAFVPGPVIPDIIAQVFAPLTSVINGMWQLFTIGLGVGLVTGASAMFLGAFIAVIVAALVAVLFNFLLRATSIVLDLIEGVLHSFVVNLPVGYKALLAPWLGALTIGLSMVLLGGMALSLLAFFAGMIIGQLIFAFLGGFVSALVSIGIFSLITHLLKPARHVFEIIADWAALALFAFAFPGLRKALWTGGYAMLLHRRLATRGMYFIGLSLLLPS
ncbi:MAG: hypothetical protein ABWK05_07140 [Pyrobaculum sp.]